MASRALSPSELILNPDGSIYHLHLRPEQVAPTIITVGDPNRVEMVSKYFDNIDTRVQKREFITHTGEYHGRRITVISTGIGPDNIDIVINELDALFNIDLSSRTIKTDHTPLQFVRIGTSGSLQADLLVDDFLFSSAGIGLDNLLFFYSNGDHKYWQSIDPLLRKHLSKETGYIPPFYAFESGRELLQLMEGAGQQGITLTCPGFYGPQGRALRLQGRIQSNFLDSVAEFSFEGQRITNFEMETAAIYGLAQLLGHEALSCNAILANRVDGTFSQKPKESVDRLIQVVLDRLTGEQP